LEFAIDCAASARSTTFVSHEIEYRLRTKRSHPGAIDSLNPGHARAAGQQWYEQWEGPKEGYRLDRDEIIRRHGKLRRFSGKVVLVTDTQCASACLDFADLIRLVPGAVHVGKTHG